MRAWTFQDTKQKRKLGTKAPWSVGWFDPDGKKRSKRIGSKSLAEKYRRKIEGELAAGTYQSDSRKLWSDFRHEYEGSILPGKACGTQRVEKATLDHFQRIAKPGKVANIKSRMLDDYVAVRRNEPGKKRGALISVATVNRELRTLKAVLNVAHDWGYLPTVPKVRMLKEPKRIVRFMTPEHFADIYVACNAARLPKGLPYPPSVWWQALLVFGYMTGWRISEPLALRREDLDLENASAITRADDNKGNRDDLVPLHAVVVEHLQKIASFEPIVFPWYHNSRTLWTEFAKIQRAAGIHLDCHEKHEHTPACHVYGFHDLRRAFATVNAETLTADALQAMMRHKSYSTTQGYINMARQLNRSVEGLQVPDVLKKGTA